MFMIYIQNLANFRVENCEILNIAMNAFEGGNVHFPSFECNNSTWTKGVFLYRHTFCMNTNLKVVVGHWMN